MKSQNKNTEFNIALSSLYIINIDLRRRRDKKMKKKIEERFCQQKSIPINLDQFFHRYKKPNPFMKTWMNYLRN